MSDITDLIGFIISLLIFTNWSFYLVLHWIYKAFQLPPGALIAWQIWAVLIYQIGNIYTFSILIFDPNLTDLECRIIGTIETYAWCLLTAYNVWLWQEIYNIAKNPLDNNYNKRANFYHIISMIFPIAAGIFIFVFDGIDAAYDGKGCALDKEFFVIYCIIEFLAIIWLILIIMTTKVMSTNSRYLYRYIVFQITEFITSTLYLINQFVPYEVAQPFYIIIVSCYLFMSTWRILEVTVLNNYFNSMKNDQGNTRNRSYIPPNQSLFQANMIAGVQALMISLTHLFERLDDITQNYLEDDLQLLEHSTEPGSIENKIWKLEKLQGSFFGKIEQFQNSGILITEYAPEIFRGIRIQNQISNSYLKELFEAQEIDQIRKNVGNPGGASGQFFYFTSDKRFIIKTITQEEKQVMFEGFLNEYSKRISDSLLARIYGIYQIIIGTQEPFSIMLMGNLALPELEVITQFDLKGSKVNRKVNRLSSRSTIGLDSRTVYKDEDFEHFYGGILPNSPNIIIEKLIQDSSFLEQHNIMDYSVLLKICKPSSESSSFLFHGENYTYWIGIIDFLQKYTWSKQAELKLKSIVNDKEQVSSQNPAKYAKRFRKKMIEYISKPAIN